MVTGAFSLSVNPNDLGWQLREFVESHVGWRATEYVSANEYGNDELLERSNYDAIMKELRAVEGEIEGRWGDYPDYEPKPDNCTWFEEAGRILWKSTISDEQLKELYAYRVCDKWNVSEAVREMDVPPLLDQLLDLCNDLDESCVLDDDDLYRRELDACIEEIKDEAPDWIKPMRQSTALKIMHFLDSGNDYGRAEQKLPDCDPRYQVDFESGECHTKWDKENPVYLPECIKYAMKTMGIHPRPPRKG